MNRPAPRNYEEPEEPGWDVSREDSGAGNSVHSDVPI